ncbi:hypothetical protein HUS23_07070 [Ectothiorhodospiraceae bacterium 2226]|nr:hypothetical protein HUS23_07070 [Ectothiorhodospiraceae bacterium 2226]
MHAKSQVFEKFKNLEGALVAGIVREQVQGALHVDLGEVTGVLPEAEAIPGERFQPGERIDAYLVEAVVTPAGVTARLSRAAPMFLVRVFENAVPEIREGAVAIQAVAREAGSRAKLALRALVPGLDPIETCAGVGGAQVRRVTEQLHGETVDLVRFSEDIEAFAREALLPLRVRTVSVDHEAHALRVKLALLQRPMSHAQRSQHVRLACSLTGWNIELQS